MVTTDKALVTHPVLVEVRQQANLLARLEIAHDEESPDRAEEPKSAPISAQSR